MYGCCGGGGQNGGEGVAGQSGGSSGGGSGSGGGGDGSGGDGGGGLGGTQGFPHGESQAQLSPKSRPRRGTAPPSLIRIEAPMMIRIIDSSGFRQGCTIFPVEIYWNTDLKFPYQERIQCCRYLPLLLFFQSLPVLSPLATSSRVSSPLTFFFLPCLSLVHGLLKGRNG